MKKEVSKQIIAGDSSKITTLQTLNGNGTTAGAHVTAPVTTGWLEGVAQASQANSVGGLSKTTYQAQNWFNQFVDAAGTLTLANLDELFIQSQIYNPSGTTPDIMLMSPSCYAAFLNLMDNRIQYISVGDREGLNAGDGGHLPGRPHLRGPEPRLQRPTAGISANRAKAVSAPTCCPPTSSSSTWTRTASSTSRT